MKLSEHFQIEEFTQSQTAERLGLDNDIPIHLWGNVNRLAQGMEKVRALLGKPISITSGYRSPEVNRAVGSKNTSQHTTGNAADFICPAYGDPAKIVAAIVSSDIEYDQVIQEYASKPGAGWVHISFSDRNRRQALVIDKQGTREWTA
jgi:zinc D-Ala-D-Ala carboxypeptidase